MYEFSGSLLQVTPFRHKNKSGISIAAGRLLNPGTWRARVDVPERCCQHGRFVHKKQRSWYLEDTHAGSYKTLTFQAKTTISTRERYVLCRIIYFCRTALMANCKFPKVQDVRVTIREFSKHAAIDFERDLDTSKAKVTLAAPRKETLFFLNTTPSFAFDIHKQSWILQNSCIVMFTLFCLGWRSSHRGIHRKNLKSQKDWMRFRFDTVISESYPSWLFSPRLLRGCPVHPLDKVACS